MSTLEQKTIDHQNIEFWNTLCGTHLAKSLGITSNTKKDLKKFDDWYFDFYPYLYQYIPFASIANKKVLEIGLGYGTVAQKLMEYGANYHGLDISHGPVAMAQHRAELLGMSAQAQQGSALSIPYESNTFDCIVSIGCLHHTGDLTLALNEVLRTLKTGGNATIMLYNALSYRHWSENKRATLKRLFHPQSDFHIADKLMREKYDTDMENKAAPYTTFVSRAEIKQFFKNRVKNLKIHTTNIGDDKALLRLVSRKYKLKFLGPWIGLDHYIEFNKV